jgi:nucleoside-triphosphatase THEP1
MKQNVETSDIVFAATLKVKGFRLDRIKKDGRRGIFCFTDVDSSEINQFNLGQALVEPVALNNAIKTLTTATKRIL